MRRRIFKGLKYSFISFICFIAVMYAVDIVRNYCILYYMKDKVVMVGEKSMVSRGTGFFIKGGSGMNFVVTNAHICDDIGKNDNIYVQKIGFKPIARRIIAVSDKSDLCLVEALDNSNVLKIAEYKEFEEVTSFGFPSDHGFAPLAGTILHEEQVTFPDSKNIKCNSPKNLKIMGLCLTRTKYYQTTITTLGGNSGSPVVNFWGNVVGVMFAHDMSENNWGMMIPSEDLNDFVREY